MLSEQGSSLLPVLAKSFLDQQEVVREGHAESLEVVAPVPEDLVSSGREVTELAPG